MGYTDAFTKIRKLIRAMPRVLITKPLFLISSLPQLLSVHSRSVAAYYRNKNNKNIWKNEPSLRDYTLKASIIASFKPDTFLEIGTGAGWGVCIFASVLPNTRFKTMTPRLNAQTGSVIKRKPKLKIKQIWADSMTYNFKKLGSVDVAYIDGDHSYKYVLSDLMNTAPITKKMLILDDYIPSPTAKRDPIIRWASYFKEVVDAVDTFLRSKQNNIEQAYWIEGTKICVLVKKKSLT